tara:strand:+ start:753 stop:935 length:183 start_codon:yes stop_codon:yes gene_type:complete
MKIQIGDEVRDMTAEEAAQYKADLKDFAAQEKADFDKATAKAALLDRLGITADEAALLLG